MQSTPNGIFSRKIIDTSLACLRVGGRNKKNRWNEEKKKRGLFFWKGIVKMRTMLRLML